MSEYRVNLDIYNGPLDLLLYLIRRDEVDIYDIPIAGITAQYVQYVELLQKLDPNLAGEFLVMAATLMEIKTRMLLPRPEAGEDGEEAEGLDPRAELVRQLLEYKAFKDAADDLRTAGEEQGRKFPRGKMADLPTASEIDLEDVQVWDLLDAFNGLMAAIGANLKQHEVIYDDTPLELHATDIADRLAKEGPLTFAQIFEGRTSRLEVVGLFLALLELVRQKRAMARQEGNFGEIYIHLRPGGPESVLGETEEDQDAPPTSRDREGAEQDVAASPDDPPPMELTGEDDSPAEHGRYVSETPPPQESDDDDASEEDRTAWS